jgi:hypothetical protein
LGGGTFDVTYWARDALVPNKQNPYPFGFTAIPQEYLSLRDMKNLSSDLAVHPNIDECEQIMVNAIRGVAAQHNTVGKDCMSILVLNANGLKLRIRYRPVFEYRHSLALSSGELELPASFTPWFISRGFVKQPQVMVGGGGKWLLAGIPTLIEAPPIPPNPFITMGMFSQRRKRDPLVPRKPDKNPLPRAPLILPW